MPTNPNNITVFDNIQIGKKFKTPAKIVYQKKTTKLAKPILDAKGNAITNGRETAAFYNSKIKIELV